MPQLPISEMERLIVERGKSIHSTLMGDFLTYLMMNAFSKKQSLKTLIKSDLHGQGPIKKNRLQNSIFQHLLLHILFNCISMAAPQNILAEKCAPWACGPIKGTLGALWQTIDDDTDPSLWSTSAARVDLCKQPNGKRRMQQLDLRISVTEHIN